MSSWGLWGLHTAARIDSPEHITVTRHPGNEAQHLAQEVWDQDGPHVLWSTLRNAHPDEHAYIARDQEGTIHGVGLGNFDTDVDDAPFDSDDSYSNYLRINHLYTSLKAPPGTGSKIMQDAAQHGVETGHHLMVNGAMPHTTDYYNHLGVNEWGGDRGQDGFWSDASQHALIAGDTIPGTRVNERHDHEHYSPVLREDRLPGSARTHGHTASTDGIRYAHLVEADVAEDLLHLASAAQDEAEARGERLLPLPIRRQRIQDKYWSKPWAESETLLRPHGKNVTLYHRTTPEEADRLVEKGFKHKKKNPDTKDVYFSDVLDGSAQGFGHAIVKVVLPYTAIGERNTAPTQFRHRRLDDPTDTEWQQDGPAENWYQIDSKHLKGVPVTRLAMPNPLPAGVHFRYHPELMWGPGVTAHQNGKQVGSLEWYDDDHIMVDMGVRKPGEIDRIGVPEDHRGNSIATSMFDFAKQHEPRLHHSDTLTPDGEGWSAYEKARHGRLAAPRVQDPAAIVERLRNLNYRNRIHKSQYPAPDRVIAQNPPLSAREEKERQKLLGVQDDLDQRWNNMAPMADHEIALHKALRPAAHRHDDLDALPDRQKAYHFANLSNIKSIYGLTPREQHQHDALKPFAEQHFAGMQEQAQDDLNRWNDYHQKGYHWNGNSSLEGQHDAHSLHNTADWGAEMTRMTSDRTPVRQKLNTEHFLHVAQAGRDHREALAEMAEHGPLYQNPDRHENSYAYQHVEDTRNKLRVELQHKKVFSVPEVSELSPVGHPKEAHADDNLVNPRYADGMNPGGGYQSYAEQRAYKINCQRSILAAEARHKGHNVEAQRNYQPFEGNEFAPENDQTFDDHEIAGWFMNPDGSRPTWHDVEDDPTAAAKEPIPSTDKPTHLWDHMHEQIAGWGPGARGVIGVTYKSNSGATKRHVLSVKVHDDGRVHYYDPQTSETNQDQHWRERVDYDGSDPDFATRRWGGRTGVHATPTANARAINRYYSPLRYMRLDDKELHPSVSKHLVDRGTAPDTPIYAPKTN